MGILPASRSMVKKANIITSRKKNELLYIRSDEDSNIIIDLKCKKNLLLTKYTLLSWVLEGYKSKCIYNQALGISNQITIFINSESV